MEERKESKVTFVMFDIDRHEKIGEAYDVYMCQDMLWMFWEHNVDNIQIQRIVEKGEEEVDG